MKLSIIIVNYNTKELLKQCIESIGKSRPLTGYEIIVVDNASTDGSVELLKDYKEVIVLKNACNTGFAKANNQGYDISTGEYVLLLNSDTIVLKGALDRLTGFMDSNPGTAIAGPRLLNNDMSLQLPCRRGFPKFINSVAHFSGLSKIFPKNRILGNYLMTYLNDKETHEVDAVSGACMMVRREYVKRIGGLLDEAFFMHFEDIDLCYRAKKQGYKVCYVHDSEVIHLKGQSSKKRNREVMGEFYRSARIYFKKNYKDENPIAYLFLMSIIKIMQIFSIMSYDIKHLRKKV